MEWLIRIQDRRRSTRTRAEIVRDVIPELEHHVQVLSGPSSVFHPRHPHPGEWCFRIVDTADRSGPLLRVALTSRLMRIRCELINCDNPGRPARSTVDRKEQPAGPAETPARPLRVVNSPYSNLGQETPYAGEIR